MYYQIQLWLSLMSERNCKSFYKELDSFGGGDPKNYMNN